MDSLDTFGKKLLFTFAIATTAEISIMLLIVSAEVIN